MVPQTATGPCRSIPFGVTSYRHVYVHVPFCARRCSYCDFAIAVRGTVPAKEFARAIAAEVQLQLGDASVVPLESLYLGGGTPSRLGPDGVARLMDALLARFALAPSAEVTLEGNPEDVTPAAVAAWRTAGITRVSLGVQSFDPGVLQWMHRVHTAEQAVRAVHAVRDGGIDRLSVDLIYALPESVPRQWERDLDTAIALAPGHLSCYGLTIEPRTPLGRWEARGRIAAASEEAYERDFLVAHARLTSAGYQHYEVSNYATAGNRAVHNSSYWSGAAYLGLGPSAHGFDGSVRRWNVREFAAWDSAVAAGRDPVDGAEELTPEQRAIEEIYLGLRSDSGLEWTDRDRPLVETWRREGWAEPEGRRVRLTPGGWLRLDALAAALTHHRSRY